MNASATGRKQSLHSLRFSFVGAHDDPTVLPWHKEIPHPGGKGDIVLTSDGTLGGGPFTRIPVYFDGEGLRLSQIPDDANADR